MKFILGLAILCAVTVSLAVEQEANPFPRYKPFSRAPAPLDIHTNTYGASRTAPNALGVGDTVPDFTVPRAGGGMVSLADARYSGPVAVIFYRGHW